MYYVYELACADDMFVRYVGFTKCLEKRLKNHLADSRCSRVARRHVSNWLRKARRDGREIVMVEYARFETKEEATSAERERIAYYRSIFGYPLTNLTAGGEGMHGYVPNEESLSKLRARMLGNKYTLGYHHTAAAREKISEACRSHWENPDYRRRLSAKRTGNTNGRNPTRRFVGITRARGGWGVQINISNKVVYFGQYQTDIEAAYAANVILELLGRVPNDIPNNTVSEERGIEIRAVVDQHIQQKLAA